jgi:hypothetical protein
MVGLTMRGRIALLAAAALCWATPTLAQPAALNKFAQDVVTRMRTGRDMLADSALPALFSARLATAIRKDRKPGEVGVLDYDPFCQCQDNEGLKVRVLGVSAKGASGQISLEDRFGSRVIKVDLRMVQERGQWRIADISTAGAPSLIRLLESGQ